MTIVEFFKENIVAIDEIKNKLVASLPDSLNEDILFAAIALFSVIIIKSTAKQGDYDESQLLSKFIGLTCDLLPFIKQETKQ